MRGSVKGMNNGKRSKIKWKLWPFWWWECMIWRGGDEQWWWAKWIWFLGIRRSAKTPIVSPWTQEPNLSRLILMTSNNDEDQGKCKSGYCGNWKKVGTHLQGRWVIRIVSKEPLAHIWWWYMGTYQPVLMRLEEFNWWSDPLQLIVIKITMDRRGGSTGFWRRRGWKPGSEGAGSRVIKVITTPVVKCQKRGGGEGGAPSILVGPHLQWQGEGKWGHRWERGQSSYSSSIRLQV